MAKASWCNVSPMSGSENGTLTISAAAHAGREARSTTVTVTAKNGTKTLGQYSGISGRRRGSNQPWIQSKPDLPSSGGGLSL
ncbi:BACON domain-containing protein [Bacteroides fragilis]|nr:BACON domain-containing protein [Bacteroides fragilis]